MIQMNIRLIVEYFINHFDTIDGIELDDLSFFNFQEYFAKIIHDEFLLECFKLISIGGPSGGYDSAEIDMEKSKSFEIKLVIMKNTHWETFFKNKKKIFTHDEEHSLKFK
jgi:hypothetical protein